MREPTSQRITEVWTLTMVLGGRELRSVFTSSHKPHHHERDRLQIRSKPADADIRESRRARTAGSGGVKRSVIQP